MSSQDADEAPVARDGVSRLATGTRKAIWGLFFAAYMVVWTGLWLPDLPVIPAKWWDGLLLLLGTLLALSELARELPTQNVVMAAVIIAGIAGLSQYLAMLAGVDVGRSDARWLLLPGWIVAVLASRGTARLILRRWRNRADYGFWLLGLSALLLLVLDLGWEPFATEVRGYQIWNRSGTISGWYGVPWRHFLVSGVVAMLSLVSIAPALINKKPVASQTGWLAAGRSCPGSTVLWLSANLLFLTGLTRHNLWLAAALVGLSLVAVALVTALARVPRGSA